MKLLGLLCSPLMSLKIFLGEAIVTAAYLNNRMSSRVLKFQTPCHSLLQAYPQTRLISTPPVIVFGHSACAYVYQQHRSKLDPKAIKCIFLEYSPNQNGYKCYFLATSKFYHFVDVTFFENQPFYSKREYPAGISVLAK